MRALLLILALLAAPARAGWTAGAWPACEHVGGREFAPGVLYKQIWARDLFHAIEERARGLYATGTTNLWAGTGVSRPSWWTADGVTNRVVRYDRGGANLGDNGARFLPAAKMLVAVLATAYLDKSRLDPDDMPASWHAWQLAGGARTNIPALTETFTKLRWGCPGSDHTDTITLYDQDARAATPYPLYSATGLSALAGLPRDYLTVTPFRLLEGFCDPTTAALGPSFVYSPTGQGTSPHASGLWYWSDFGWDGLRAILAEMTHRVVVWPYSNPIAVDWWWDESGDNFGEEIGEAAETYQRLTPGPDVLLSSGDLAAAQADAAGNRQTDRDGDETPFDPYYIYLHSYTATLRANVVDGAEYGCYWRAYFRGRQAKPAAGRLYSWPPAGATATIRFYSETETWTAPTGQKTWVTEALGQVTASSPGTTELIATNIIGHITIDPALQPDDPASVQGLPEGLELGGEDLLNVDFEDYDATPGAARGNLLRESKDWSDPFAIIEFQWSYP